MVGIVVAQMWSLGSSFQISASVGVVATPESVCVFFFSEECFKLCPGPSVTIPASIGGCGVIVCESFSLLGNS